jgi:NAD(P)-dependent dehydrogenase (short-subunit alcohol dehydrogenase family)
MGQNLYSEFDLSGKVAIVTGAARGLGYHYSLALAKYGADLVVCDILFQELEIAKSEFEKFGHKVLIQRTDVSKIPEINRMV